MGITQVFHHALSAALYPIAPLYDAKVSSFVCVFVCVVLSAFSFAALSLHYIL